MQLILKEELKFVSTMPGEVSVTIPGVLPVPVLSVASWDFSELVSAICTCSQHAEKYSLWTRPLTCYGMHPQMLLLSEMAIMVHQGLFSGGMSVALALKRG